MSARVRDRATFAALAQARRLRRGPVTLRHVPGAPDAPARVAFAVGRACGGAVQRNRARRRLRAAVAARGELAPGAYLFGGGPEVTTMPFPALVEHVRELTDAVRTPG